MQFGLFGAATAQRGDNPDVDSAAGFKDYIEYLIEAEALGFHSSFIVEHHFTGFGQVSATLNLLTWIGAKTRTLRLGTAVIVLPWHNPVLLAEQAATIDLLSGGRLDFGIGKGYRHNEFAGFRIPMEEAEPRFEEAIDIITKVLDVERAVQLPRQVLAVRRHHRGAADQPEAASAVLAGRRARSTRSRRVAKRGHNLLVDQFCPIETAAERVAFYKAEMEKNGFDYDPSMAGVARAFYVARDAADKEAAIDRRLAAQQRLTAISQRPDGNNTASIMAFSDTRAASEASAMYGSPDDIARKLERLRDQGVEYVLLNGGGTSRDNLRRFAREVMPAFRTEPQDRAAV